MEIILEKEKVAAVRARWDRQYPELDARGKRLHALPWPNVTADQVDEAIGNQSWTKDICGECGEYASPVVRFGAKHGGSEFDLCPICIGKAAVLADAIAKLK